MKKKIRRMGSGIGIYFNKEEANIYEIKEGDIVDIELVKVRQRLRIEP